MTASLFECRGLTVRFGGLTALDDLDFQVGAREIVGLVGPNGSGKTTFFNTISGFYRASSGTVRLDGADLSGRPPQAVNRAGIARTFQRSRLILDLTVFDNVAIGTVTKLDGGIFSLFARTRFKRDLDRLTREIGDILRRFNPALVDRLFDPAGELSMIDRRRVEIARALICRPRLLLLDEPSAGMTHHETRRLMDEVLSFRDTNPSLSIVLVEHAMDVIQRVSDRCVVLNFGKKLYEGPFREMISDPTVQLAYLGQEAR